MSDILEITLNIPEDNYTFVQGNSSDSYDENMLIDWGDGSNIIPFTGGMLEHTYEDEGTYTIKMKGITSIPSLFFNSNTLVTSVKVPSTIQIIPQGFLYKSSVESVMLERGVGMIRNGFCYNCSNLKEVTIPFTVSIINGGISQLIGADKIIFEGVNPPSMQSSPYTWTKQNIYVPNIDNYKKQANYPDNEDAYVKLPLAYSIANIYNYLKTILEEDFDMVINDGQNGDVQGLTSLIDKINQI